MFEGAAVAAGRLLKITSRLLYEKLANMSGTVRGAVEQTLSAGVLLGELAAKKSVTEG
jgi:hypothetical protein